MEVPAADTSMSFGMYGVATVLLTAVNRRHFSLCYLPGHQENGFPRSREYMAGVPVPSSLSGYFRRRLI